MADKKSKRPRVKHGRKRKTETAWEYLKRVRAEYDKHLEGTVITPQPPFTRADRREMTMASATPRFSAGNRRHRVEGANDLGPDSDMPHESPFTKPPIGRRRKVRRAQRANARRARRRNRR